MNPSPNPVAVTESHVPKVEEYSDVQSGESSARHDSPETGVAISKNNAQGRTVPTGATLFPAFERYLSVTISPISMP